MSRETAQAIVDGWAALGALAFVLALIRRRERNPLSPRFAFLFGLVAVFYGLRSLMVWTGWDWARTGSLAVICLAPLGGLFLAEGLMRRHAPIFLKVGMAGVDIVAALFALLSPNHLVFGLALGQGGVVLFSFVAVLILLLLRDRRSLSASENQACDVFSVALALAAPLLTTDFPELMVAPVGLSPLAALVATFVALAANLRYPRDAWVELALVILAAALLTLALAAPLGLADWSNATRLFAICAAAMMTAVLLVRIKPFGTVTRRSRLRRRLTGADMTSLPAFLNSLAEESVFRDLTVLDAASLADYDMERMASALALRPIWTQTDLVAGQSELDEATREAMEDLFERCDATHVGLLHETPLSVGVLRLAAPARGDEVETDLALAFRMARLSGRR